MINFKYLTYCYLAFSLLTHSCTNKTQENQTDLNVVLTNDTQEVSCPHNHTDSIIPIIYGLPSAETFEQADSGLVALGGCELEDYNYYCKKHNIRF